MKIKVNIIFIYQISNILYSTIITSLINIIIKYLSLTEKKILEIKKEKNFVKDKIYTNLKKMSIKLIIYINFLISSFFLVLFIMFLRNLKKSQIHLITETLSSFGLSFLFPFILNLFPGILRIPSIKSKNRGCLFMLSKLLQLI